MNTSNGNNGNNNSFDSLSQDLGLHVLELVRIGSSKAQGFLVVAPDKLSVKYTGVNLHGHDVGVVQANNPVPVKRLVYYFEIYVKDAGVKGKIAIGFTSEGFKMRRQPGWEEFFFTKNGAIVGTVSKEKEMNRCLFPTISVHSQNEEVHVNFGQRKFAFDLKEYEAQERLTQQMTIEKISLPPNISYGIVRAYLLHYGYEDTLNSFDLACKSTIPPICIAQENGFDDQDIMYALNQRKTIRHDNKSAACFLLHCQKFVEFIRVGALEEAVKHGRIELAKFLGLPEKDNLFDALVMDCVAPLAYECPQESCFGYLLQESHRDVVADTVNAMILSTNPKMKGVQGCLQECFGLSTPTTPTHRDKPIGSLIIVIATTVL
ncbi:hypothetical protein V6N12_070380 [Hibiscus sabdariffa]|uniref:CTLH domain-containing protein n=1 Tax=Hibiscus sabdariffa TaxID=183260 RepID=A0ABR2FGM1_9ROSI